MNANDIRAAFRSGPLRRYERCPDTLVIDELGLDCGLGRIDLAVIGGSIRGYEIKSGLDSLARLPAQLATYRQAVQQLTFVTVPGHLPRVGAGVPGWCGLVQARRGPRGGVRFAPIRRARANPDLVPARLALLLWRRELAELLENRGFQPKELRRPRRELAGLLAAEFALPELTAAIRACMLRRTAWREPSGRPISWQPGDGGARS